MKPTYKQLSEYLGVSEQAVKMYRRTDRGKKKVDLMLLGLSAKINTKEYQIKNK